jgi:hypothetical protein
MWPIGLEAMLGVLGLKILLIEDETATARTLALRTPVDRANQRIRKCVPYLGVAIGATFAACITTGAHGCFIQTCGQGHYQIRLIARPRRDALRLNLHPR